MAHIRPGTYVLYKEAISERYTCPAIVYTDDLAPLEIQRSRPTSGYVTLILLIPKPPEPFRFRWATTGQLSSLSSLEGPGLAVRSPEELEAGEVANFWKETGYGIEQWRSEVNQHGWQALSNHTSEPRIKSDKIVRDEDYEGEDEEDKQMREAIRLSREDHYGTTHSQLATPSISPPEAGRLITHSETITLHDEESDHDSLFTRPLKKSRSQPSSKQSHYYTHSRNSARVISPIFSDNEGQPRRHMKDICHKKQQETRPRFSGGVGLDQLLGRSSFGQPSAAPTSDIIEGRICESKDFVQVPVGPDGEIRTFQKKDVWSRPYFQDSRTGINHLRLNEDNIWELAHPQLVHIELDDFQFIAEYLTDGEFGVRNPEGPDQNKEAIAQCVSAWETAEKLAMDDMLEHISEKVRFLEWDNEDVLTLAILVYRTAGPSLHAHEMMKDWISSFLAHHFWMYIKDEAIGHYFRKRLRRLPELERDVFEKRAESLRTGTDPDEDVESDEGGLDDDDL